MNILLDAGHGCNTAGKRSLDGRLIEGIWSRKMVAVLAAQLTAMGHNVVRLVPEEEDIPLAIRARRANAAARRDTILISLHADADPNAVHGPTAARGLSTWVYDKASPKSLELACAISREACACSLLGNRRTPACGYRRANFAILRETKCPAVLVECGFMTNESDVTFLLSRVGMEKIAHAIANACLEYQLRNP